MQIEGSTYSILFKTSKVMVMNEKVDTYLYKDSSKFTIVLRKDIGPRWELQFMVDISI